MITIKSVNMRKTFLNETDSMYAVFDCNLEIKKGEFVVISGEKDSGKTTLLHLLGGYERPSGGTLYIKDNNVTQYSDDELAVMRRNEVGYMLQSDSLIPELNVRDNIMIPLILAGKECEEEYFNELTDCLRLTGLLNYYPKQLSMNQLRNVTLARALINQPNIILMDEPVHDDVFPQISKEVMDYLLNAVYQCQKTLIMVSNNPDYFIYANHIIKLRSGVVFEDRLL